MDLSVITVTWNAADHIAAQIESVRAARRFISCEQIIVDNGSVDATVAQIQFNASDVKIIKNKTNLGFGAANNIGAAASTGRYLLFLNSDMSLPEGSLDLMVKWLDEHPKAGLAGPRLTTAGGKFNVNAAPRRFPNILEATIIFFKLGKIFPSLLNRYLYAGFNDKLEQEVDSVRGSCLFMRRALYERLGHAFDPRYFIWWEDVDACREAKRLGWAVLYAPIFSATDQVGKSFKKRNIFWRQWYFFKSCAQYFWKWRIERGFRRI